MLIPIIVSSVFILAAIILCRIKPNAGRIFLGLFFLVMALGVNGFWLTFDFGLAHGMVFSSFFQCGYLSAHFAIHII